MYAYHISLAKRYVLLLILYESKTMMIKPILYITNGKKHYANHMCHPSDMTYLKIA